MRVRLLFRVIILLLITSPSVLIAQSAEISRSQNAANVANRADSQSNVNAGNSSTDPKKTKLETDKVEVELEKLRTETEGLKITNATLTWWARFLTALLASLGTIVAGLLIWFLGRSHNKTQESKLKQDIEINAKRYELESSKLDQDRKLGREKHHIEVFQALGNEEPRVRVGAVAVLVQRIAALRRKGEITLDDKEEIDMLVSVLISVTKYEDKAEVQKYIADGLARSLEAIIPPKKQPTSAVSPLKHYDFQGAKLEDAWWMRIDARDVDFYKAHLVRAGLKEAFLSDAVLMNANLTEAILIGAHLEKANLQGAKLKNAKLNEANLQGATLDDVDLSEAELDGADLSNAKLNGTILKRAQLDLAKFDGVDLSKAVFDV